MHIKPKNECEYDLVSLGEVMLRFDPGDSRIRCARSFNVWEGGGEYNVARSLRKCFGLKTAVLTALVSNDLGLLIEDFILQGGVDTSMIRWLDFDGIGATARNGLNFTERGYSLRGALGVSDRANTAAMQLKPGDFNLEGLFAKKGVRWLHTGGIFAALSDSTAALTMEVLKAAKIYDTIVSYDMNYRSSLWKEHGGKVRAQEVNRELARYVDVLLGNEEDFSACLGIDIGVSDDNFLHIDTVAFETMIRTVAKEYPNLSVIATTLRQVKSASINNWSAICYMDEKVYSSNRYEDMLVFDRVGGGDSFASGLIFGFMELNDPAKAVEYGAAHGALAMTTPGDTSMANRQEVEALINGKGSRIVR